MVPVNQYQKWHRRRHLVLAAEQAHLCPVRRPYDHPSRSRRPWFVYAGESREFCIVLSRIICLCPDSRALSLISGVQDPLTALSETVSLEPVSFH